MELFDQAGVSQLDPVNSVNFPEGGEIARRFLMPLGCRL
jgi:hypothetical protein